MEQPTTAEDPEVLAKLWDSGILVDLTVSYYRATERLSPEDVNADPEKANQREVSLGKKQLFKDEDLKPIERAEGKARNAVHKHSLGFPIGGARFVPEEAWPELCQDLEEAKQAFDEAVAEFLANWEDNKEEMLEEHSDLLLESDYPNPDFLSYSMVWHTFELDPRGEQMDEKIQSAIDEFVRDTVATLRDEVAEKCANQAERLEEGKAISERQLNALRRMIREFEKMNFVGDEPTEEALDELREQLTIRDAEEIREDEDCQAEFKRVLDLVTERAENESDIGEVASGFTGRVVQVEEEAEASEPEKPTTEEPEPEANTPVPTTDGASEEEAGDADVVQELSKTRSIDVSDDSGKADEEPESEPEQESETDDGVPEALRQARKKALGEA
jgi:hypothetical protein